MPTLYAWFGPLTDAASLWPSAIDRLHKGVTMLTDDECWPWTGPLDKDGYGYFTSQHENVRIRTSAHRVAFVLAHGSIAPDLVVDHLCRNHVCCNPAHLESVTNAENIRRGDVVGPRSQCRKGHDIRDSSAVYVTCRGTRQCRICLSEYRKQWRAARRTA